MELEAFEDVWQEPVQRLYRQVFGAAAATAWQSRWRWAQEETPLPAGNPRWVLRDGDEVVGFLATLPLLYRVKGASVVAHTPCEFMVHPEYRFHGIKLMRAFFQSCGNCVTCDDIPSTIKVTRWLGARHVGTLVRYVKLLDIRALQRRHAWAGASPVRWPVNLALRRIDRRRLRPGQTGFAVVPLSGFGGLFQDFFHQLAIQSPVMPYRDARFLEWRYGGASPHAGREVGGVVNRDGRLLGYVIFYHAEHPARTGYIMDLQTLPPHRWDLARELLGYAVERLREAGAWTVRYHHLASLYNVPGRLLQEYGFRPRGRHLFLARFSDPALARVAEDQENWNYSYGDSEASHALV